MNDEVMDGPAHSASPDGGRGPSAARRTERPRAIIRWTALGFAVIALLAAGGCRKAGQTQVDPIAEFRAAMEKQGWESLDTDPGKFIAKSSYELWDEELSGFVTLIEYRDQAAARTAQDQRSMEASAAPGFEETDDGSVSSWSSLDPSDTDGGQPPGTGSLDVQFSKYRFESGGDRSKIDALVSKLGYLDPNRTRTDPIAEFQAAVKESQIATGTDSGYSERSAFKNGDLVAECKLFFTPEDAEADLDALARWLESEKQEFKVSGDGSVRSVWFVTEWPDSSGKKIEQYATRTYSGQTMTAVSGPVEKRSEMDELMKSLGY